MKMNKTLEDVQKKLQNEVDNLKQVQKEHHKVLSSRQQLDSQLTENNIVKKELELLKDDDEVFKLIGPVLVKTDIIEAKQNVSKRIEFINKELKRIDDQISNLDKKQESHRENLQKLQHQFQQAQVKAAMKV